MPGSTWDISVYTVKFSAAHLLRDSASWEGDRPDNAGKQNWCKAASAASDAAAEEKEKDGF